jgi:aminoglycoside/choline kinase family phosphotransferase
MEIRLNSLKKWLKESCSHANPDLAALPQDASFRRYYRLSTPEQSYIVMDAPPSHEDTEPFTRLATHFKEAGVLVPTIFAKNHEEGFLLLSDFGDNLLNGALTPSNASTLYQQAIDTLIQIHQAPSLAQHPLPRFDRQLIEFELNNFTKWYGEKYLRLALTPAQHQQLKGIYDLLIRSAENQPQVCCHRDYHSRNLLLLPSNEIGVIDFQDAVIGPITYDIASLLRDCYIDWPENLVDTCLYYFYEKAQEAKLLPQHASFEQLKIDFDLMGTQRHLKAIFIFARKFLRDNDNTYLPDIDRALNYIKNCCKRHPALDPLQDILLHCILPKHEKTRETIE